MHHSDIALAKAGPCIIIEISYPRRPLNTDLYLQDVWSPSTKDNSGWLRKCIDVSTSVGAPNSIKVPLSKRDLAKPPCYVSYTMPPATITIHHSSPLHSQQQCSISTLLNSPHLYQFFSQFLFRAETGKSSLSMIKLPRKTTCRLQCSGQRGAIDFWEIIAL